MESSFVTFDEAKAALGIEDDALHAMISRGELRAFRDEGMLKFRREDVAKVVAAGGQAAPATAESRQAAEAEPPTIPSIELVGDDDATGAIEAIAPVLEEEGGADKTQAVELPAEADQTAELTLEEGVGDATQTLPLADVEQTAGAETVREAPPLPARRRRPVVAEEEEPSSPFATTLLLVAVLVLLAGAAAIVGGMFTEMPDAIQNFFTGLVKPPAL